MIYLFLKWKIISTMCSSYLWLCNKLPKNESLKQQTFIVSQFLKDSCLDFFDSRSLTVLWSRYWLRLCSGLKACLGEDLLWTQFLVSFWIEGLAGGRLQTLQFSATWTSLDSERDERKLASAEPKTEATFFCNLPSPLPYFVRS